MGSHAAKNHVNLLTKCQNFTIWKILYIPWYGQNFQAYNEIDIAHLNDFIQLFNPNSHLASENIDTQALSTPRKMFC